MITCEPILCKSLVALMPASGHNLAISGPDDFLMEPFFSIHLNPVVAGCGKYDFKLISIHPALRGTEIMIWMLAFRRLPAESHSQALQGQG